MADTLIHNCLGCANYDGDHYCSLPRDQRKLAGWIDEPEEVVCSQHEPAKTLDQEMQQAAKDDEHRPVGWKDRR
jgi:hypothetical protein